MIVKIIDDCRAFFAAQGVDAIVDEGPLAPLYQDTYGPGSANRVVFEPSPDPMDVVPPLRIGEDDDGHRQLLNTEFVYLVHVAGFDPSADGRWALHARVCFALWEKVIQSVQLSYAGVSGWRAPKWTLDKKLLVHGAELVAPLVLNVPFFDVAWPSATPRAVPGQPKPAGIDT